jgi:uncharacterized protein (DUF362 family)
MTEKSTIYFTKSQHSKAFLAKVVEIHQDLFKGRVLLKPNLVSNEPYPTTTEPGLFKELIALLRGKVELAAGDAPAADLKAPGEALKGHALVKAAEEQGVDFYDFYEQPMQELKTPLGDALRVSAMPARHDLVVSLPVLKTHVNLLITGALKNQFGFLDRKERFRLHFSERGLMEKAIVGLNQLVRPGLFIVDFRETLLGANERRHGGRVAKAGWLFAGTDPLALDWFGFSLLRELEPKLYGKNQDEIPYLRLARESGLGNTRFELIDI